MARVRPFRGIRYNPELVRLGGVLAPPYDVIDDAQRDALYGRDLRNNRQQLCRSTSFLYFIDTNSTANPLR